MKPALSLLVASVTGSLVFALAWLRPALPIANLDVVIGAFAGYGIAIAVLVFLVGWPIAWAASSWARADGWLR